MRTLAIFMVFICGTVLSFSQENQNVLQDKKTSCAVFASGVFSFSELRGEYDYAEGLEIGVILEGKLIVSFRAIQFEIKSIIDNMFTENRIPLIKNYYHGIHIAYNFLQNDYINFSAGSLLGIGSTFYTIFLSDPKTSFEQECKDDFLVIEPALAVNSSAFLNLLRAELRLFYRISSEYNVPQSKLGDMNGVGASFSISIGSF